MDADIRRWFLKQPHTKSDAAGKQDSHEESAKLRPDLKKTSKYFSGSKLKGSGNEETKASPEKAPAKRKPEAADGRSKETRISKRSQIELKPKEESPSPSPRKPSRPGKVAPVKEELENDEDFSDTVQTHACSPGKGRGRGRGRGLSSTAQNDEKPSSAGRGRGGWGRGGSSYEPRLPPPHKGEKEIPEGAEDCLAGSTFVISGTLDSLEREEAEDLIKRHGGRVTSAVSKKTTYLLADMDVGGQKSRKAKELGVPFLSEDGLFDMIRTSKPKKASQNPSQPMTSSPSRTLKAQSIHGTQAKKCGKSALVETVPTSSFPGVSKTEAWPQKHCPKITAEIVGNQSIVKQLHDWLQNWFHNFQGKQPKGRKRVGDNGSSNTKKAVLLSGPPGIGKTTTARLICQLLGFETFEVNASDNRGKADSKIGKGIGGSTANAIKEMVSNESLSMGVNGEKHKKAVLIMDEVDGMSGGDRGGVADLIASIKISRIPIICICNDRYSQKLKSLVNYCLPLNFRKPTKQQMAKRLQQVAKSEGMQVDEIALEELAELVNGDMRMALNELQYMSLRTHVIKFNDVKARLGSSAKDEEMSPFNAVDRLMSFGGGRLRMDERLDASMSDPDLVPLLIQENYLNYCPTLAARDENGTTRMDLIAKAASCIADGDIVNSQIRQYRQWQHSQMAAFMSSIIPAALMHGQRETLLQGERNFNRFGSWLGKNSSYGKKMCLLDDIHVHLLASRTCEPTRQSIRRDYLCVLAVHLTSPLKLMAKEEAVQTVVEFMETYSLTMEDIDSILDLLKFQGHDDFMAGVPPAVKAALTKAYKHMENERKVKSADLLPVFTPSGQKKLPKKRTKLQILPPDLDEEIAEEDEEETGSVDEVVSSDELVPLEGNYNIQLNPTESSSKQGKQSSKGFQPAQKGTKRSSSKDVQQSKPAKRRKEH